MQVTESMTIEICQMLCCYYFKLLPDFEYVNFQAQNNIKDLFYVVIYLGAWQHQVSHTKAHLGSLKGYYQKGL